MMSSSFDILWQLSVALVLAPLFLLARRVYNNYTTPLRHLPGPKNPNILWGNLKETRLSPDDMGSRWLKEYGPVMAYTGFLGRPRLLVSDVKAIAHVLHNTFDYPKPEAARYNLGRIVGPGVLVVEGHQHRQQRKVMNPAFMNSYIKELTSTFLEKSAQLRDIWAAGCATSADSTYHVDALFWLNKLTLDIIGLTGFNYKFGALDAPRDSESGHSELYEAFSSSFSSTGYLFRFLQGWMPILRLVPTPSGAAMAKAQNIMSKIGYGLLKESKDFLKASGETTENWHSRDILSLLVRANMSADIPESQRMTDEDVIAQVPTFLVAGHETTANTVGWALYALTRSSDVQRKLREELRSLPKEEPTFDELNSLPYLDSVVREVLRLHAPVPNTIRTAARDDTIPLNAPFTDRHGNVHDTVRISKGDSLAIPILAVNTDPALWGDDALDFKPERWEKVPEAVSSIPGVWGNMLSFLGGPRSCIGYRFALAETKAILFTLLRAFEFRLGVPHEDIGRTVTIVQRPFVRSDPAAGNRLPVIVNPFPS